MQRPSVSTSVLPMLCITVLFCALMPLRAQERVYRDPRQHVGLQGGASPTLSFTVAVSSTADGLVLYYDIYDDYVTAYDRRWSGRAATDDVDAERAEE